MVRGIWIELLARLHSGYEIGDMATAMVVGDAL